MAEYNTTGPWMMYVGNAEIAPEFIADDLGSAQFTQDIAAIKTQAGTFQTPTNNWSTNTVKVNLILPDVSFVASLFPALANDNVSATAGKVTFGAKDCRANGTVPVVMHKACATDGAEDWYFPSCYLANGGTFKFAAASAITFELDIYPQLSDNGIVTAGLPGFKYDPTQQAYVAVSGS